MKILSLALVLAGSLAASCGDSCKNQHQITVQSSGKDSSKCLDGFTSCRTLEFVLRNLTSCNAVVIYSDQNLTQSFTLRGLHDVIISGSRNNTSTNIHCQKNLVFEEVRNITLEGLHWFSSSSGNTTHMKQEAMVQFYESSKVSIVNCFFTVTTNRPAVLLYNMSNGDVLLEHCYFTTSGTRSKGGGVEIIQHTPTKYARIFFVNSFFIGCSSERSGGAIFLHLTGTASHNIIHVSNSIFFNNKASRYGGHIAVNMTRYTSNNTVVILNSSFDSGQANLSGGGLFVEINSNNAPSTIIVKHSNFTRNQARYGGAVDYAQISGNNVTFTHCKFKSNVAKLVSTMSFILYENAISLATTQLQPIVFYNCHWTNHTCTQIRQLGIIVTVQIPLLFTGSTTITNTSNGPAMYIGSTTVTFEGTALFKNTAATMSGGAIYLTGMSFIIITRGLNLTFNTCSGMYGGAIYCENSVNLLVKDRPFPCVFSYEGGYEYDDISHWNATIRFIDNKSLRAGNSIFLNNYATCTKKIASKLFFNNSVFHGLHQPGEISSYPDTITPTVRVSDDTYVSDLILGQNLLLQVTPVDIFGETTVTTMTAKLQCPPLKLSRLDVYLFNGELVKTNMVLRGPEDINVTQDTCNLTLITVFDPVQFIVIKLNVSKCHFGYVYKDGKCECAGKVSRLAGLSCKISLGTAYIEEGHWFGNLTHNQLAVYPCSGNRCDYSKCHLKANSSLDIKICQLPTLVEDQDQQCLNNRGGPMCSICNCNSVFTYGATLCIPKEQCNIRSNIILACLYLLCMAIIILVFLAVLNMGLKVGSGYLYAFVYYFTVVPYFLSPAELFMVNYSINIINGVIFLNPKFLGLFHICSIPSLNALHHEALHYLSPLFIFSALLCISYIARHKPKFIRPGKFIIHGICTLILLTFTSLCKTSTSILDSVTFDPMKYVKIQPDILYFDTRQHLPFACLALFVMVILLIPFTTLLLFEPLIVRCVNLIKIRPFLDDFQACFRDNRRWMAGLYFLGRLLIFVIVPLNYKISKLLIKLVNICILFIIVVLQPYRKKHQNLIDSLLMLNLCIVGLLSNYADILLVRIGLVFLLAFAALYGVVVFILAIIRVIRRRIKWKYFHLGSYKELGVKLRNVVSSMKRDKESSDTDGILHVEVIHSRRDYNPQKLREELLSFQDRSSSMTQ